MLKRYFIFLSLCLMVSIMVSCSNDRITILFDTWDPDELSFGRTDIRVPCDDQILYFHMIKEAQIDISAVLDGKTLLSRNAVILEADDPTVVQITSVSSDYYSGVTKRLLVLRPEARKAHLTLTLSSQGKIRMKRIVLAFVERIILDEGSQAIDFDTGEIVTGTQWNAMDATQRALFDLLLNRRDMNAGSSYSYEYNLDFTYGHISFPSHLFAAYDFYPESDDLPVSDELLLKSVYLPQMFVVESSEGRIYKILVNNSWIDFTEILAAD